jgi:hypothetical protein
MPILLVFLQIVFVVINFYPSLLLPSFANATCHYYNYRSLTICKNKIKSYNIVQLKYETKFQRKTIIYIYIYIRKTHILETTKRKSTFFGTHIPSIFPHSLEIHLDFQNFQTSFKTPQHQKKISFPNSFMTHIKEKGLNPTMFPTIHGSSSSYSKFIHLTLFPHFYIQSQPTNSLLKTIFNIFLNE